MTENEKTVLNGRVKNTRKHKGCAFADLYMDGKIQQLCFRGESMDQLPTQGDVIKVWGVMSVSNTGQPTLFVDSFEVLNVCQHIHVLKFTINDNLEERCKINQIIDNVLSGAGAIRVSTPVLTDFPGTSKILPFATKDIKDNVFYMKYTHELGLKRLMTDTMRSVYEIGHVFRNMGQGQKHYREYNVLEAQLPFKTLNDGIDIISKIVSGIANDFGLDGFNNIPVYTVEQAFKNIGMDMWTMSDEKRKNIYKNKIKKQPGPFFISNPPKEWSPLTLVADDGKTALDVELIYTGKGIAHICQEKYKYEEIKDAISGDGMDADFVEHMSGGMPPSVGFAFGVDRFLSILHKTDILKEVIPYAK